MIEPSYALAPYAFLRRVHHHWVILDLRQDQYLCLSGQEFDRLAPYVGGVCRDGATIKSSCRSISAAASQLAIELQQNGILSAAGAAERPVAQRNIERPSSALEITDKPVGVLSRAGSAFSFFRACMRADYQLRRLPLLRTVSRITRQKASMPGPKATVERIKTIVARYQAMRLLYPRSYLCLFDCLSLLELLAPHSVYPDWVFGVTTDPFEAHCWLQVGDVVINDTMDRVARFQPIMAV